MVRSYKPLVTVAALAMAAGLIAVRFQAEHPAAPDASSARHAGCAGASRAFASHQSRVWLTVGATVVRLLPDTGGRLHHQRFIVRCPSGQTLLIVNDVSVGRRVPVATGQRVVVRGQFIWDSQGGLVHFTHHQEAGGGGGWILYDGRLYSLARLGDAGPIA